MMFTVKNDIQNKKKYLKQRFDIQSKNTKYEELYST